MKRVAAIAILNDHHMLMGRRRDNQKFTNPGGHLNPGEDPKAGAAREVQEETGLVLDPHLFRHLETRIVKKPDGTRIEVHGFRVDLREKPATSMKEDPDAEVHRWQWIKLDTDLDHIADNLHVPIEDNVLLDNILKDKPMKKHVRRFWSSARKIGARGGFLDEAKDKLLEEGPQQYLDHKKKHEKKASDLIHGGKADGKPASDFPQDQVAKGMKVEREHTNNPTMAREIASDHLTEDKKYYTHLKEMEDKYVEKKAFWNGFEKRAGLSGIKDFFKNVNESADNINKFTEGARKSEEIFRKTIPNLEKGMGRGLKYLKRGGLGALGIYGASKLMAAPAGYQRYKYYKNNQELAKNKLEAQKQNKDAT